MRVEHFGYLGVVRDAKKKTDRNLKLLELQAQEGATDPFHQFNLGSEYLAVGEAGKALEYYESAWDQIVATGAIAPAYTSMLAVRMAKSYRGDGRPERTAEFVDAALPFFPGFTDLVFEQANAFADLGDDAAAQAGYERCLEMGDAPTKYTSMLGAGSFLSLTALARIRRRAADLAGAEDLLRRSLAEHPRFLPRSTRWPACCWRAAWTPTPSSPRSRRASARWARACASSWGWPCTRPGAPRRPSRTSAPCWSARSPATWPAWRSARRCSPSAASTTRATRSPPSPAAAPARRPPAGSSSSPASPPAMPTAPAPCCPGTATRISTPPTA